MNILVPDIWLREYLKTDATADDIKKYLSLCGPSIERMYGSGNELVYDVEITTNRPDSMSIFGIAREASVILPEFGIPALLVGNPYEISQEEIHSVFAGSSHTKKLTITTDALLNPRFTAVVIDNISIGQSPDFLKQYLELSGIRSINTIVDVTNYLMRAFGQPAHAFDYDKIKPGKKEYPVMKLRASKKGETITTLDGKTHTLPGDDIVMEDGSGALFDLCGIMGGTNSHISDDTETIILFLQNYEAAHVRRTSMALAHRTEAAALFEKSPDSEMVLPAITIGTKLIKKLTKGTIVSPIYDVYPKPFVPYTVRVTKEKVKTYLGKHLGDDVIQTILNSLGCTTTITDKTIDIIVPSFRRDITIDVDIIEEIARIHGYHTIGIKLPNSEPPVIIEDQNLIWEQEIKKRLRDFGYTEIYSYSMVSESDIKRSGFDTDVVYKIVNPLSADWEYMRPTLVPSMLGIIKLNQNNNPDLRLFELSNIYEYSVGDLPHEKPTLCIAETGDTFRKLKGTVETIFDILGVTYTMEANTQFPQYMDSVRSYAFGSCGYVGYIDEHIIIELTLSFPVVIAHLDIEAMIRNAHPIKPYTPIPKFPSAYEDYTLIVGKGMHIEPLLNRIKKIHHLISRATLIDSYGDSITIRVILTDPTKNLEAEDIRPIRELILSTLEKEFGAVLKK